MQTQVPRSGPVRDVSVGMPAGIRVRAAPTGTYALVALPDQRQDQINPFRFGCYSDTLAMDFE